MTTGANVWRFLLCHIIDFVQKLLRKQLLFFFQCILSMILCANDCEGSDDFADNCMASKMWKSAALTWEISSWRLAEKFHISAFPMYYSLYNWIGVHEITKLKKINIWLSPLPTRETSSGNRIICISTRERVDAKGLYERWKVNMMGSCIYVSGTPHWVLPSWDGQAIWVPLPKNIVAMKCKMKWKELYLSV